MCSDTVAAVCERVNEFGTESNVNLICSSFAKGGESMSKKNCLVLVACLMLCLAVVAFGQGRGAPLPAKPDNPQSLAHVDAAKKIAGNDPFLANPYNFYCLPGNARAN